MSPLEPFAFRAQQCAALFRLGQDVEASQVMVEIFGEIEPFIVPASRGVQQQWEHLLTVMLDCQERQNWLGLADYLQYELVELLLAGPTA